MKKLFLMLFFLPLVGFTQEPEFKKGIPEDLDKEKIIFLKHEPIKLSEFEEETKSTEYILQRQKNHNRILAQSNGKLEIAAMDYPFEYAITTPSTYFSLAEAGYKYVLQSSVYQYEHLMAQLPEDELLVFEYFIFDMQNNIAYEVFRLDEMKVYDFKLVIKRLKKAIKAAE